MDIGVVSLVWPAFAAFAPLIQAAKKSVRLVWQACEIVSFEGSDQRQNAALRNVGHDLPAIRPTCRAAKETVKFQIDGEYWKMLYSDEGKVSRTQH